MKGIKLYMIAGIVFVAVIGTLFHFVYEWSGSNVIVGLFTPVNESVWEHTKLIFFPILIYSFYADKKVNSEYPAIGTSVVAGALSGILLIISLFYTYSGIIGFNIAFVDISIFYISVIIAFYIAGQIAISCKSEIFKIIIEISAVIMIFLFIYFTFFPPKIPLFISP